MKVLFFKVHCSLLIISSCCISFGQENSLFKNHYLNPQIINPALTGLKIYPRAVLSVKKQWLGFPDAPATFMTSGDYRIGKYDFYDPKGLINKGPLKLKERIGLGATLYRDVNGPQQSFGGMVNYAYHVPITGISALSFGLSVVGTHYSFNSSDLRLTQPDDTYLLTIPDNQFRMNFNLGVFYYSNSLFGGISAAKILPDISNQGNDPEINPSYFLIIGYHYKINKRLTWEPSITLHKLATQNANADIFSKFYFKRTNWLGILFSTAGKIDLMFCIQIYKIVFTGYSYEYTFGKINRYMYGSHEIFLGIDLGIFNSTISQ